MKLPTAPLKVRCRPRVEKPSSYNTPSAGEDHLDHELSENIRKHMEQINATVCDGNDIHDCSYEEVRTAQPETMQPAPLGNAAYPAPFLPVNIAANPAMNPPVAIPPVQQVPFSSYGTCSSPPDPLTAMEMDNRAKNVVKEYFKNRKEEARTSVLRAKQAELWQKCILPLQAEPAAQYDSLYFPLLIVNTANSLHQLTGFDGIGLVLPILTSISIATQGRVKVKLTQHWREPAIDMLINIAVSGKMKTSVIEILKRPFTAYAKNINMERNAHRMAKSTAATLAKKTANKIAKDTIKEAINNGGDIAAAIEEAARKTDTLLASYEALNMPDVKLLLSKGTPHQVAKRLQEQGMCQGCITDEGDVLRSGLLGKNGDPELFLKGHTQGEYAYPAAGGDILVRPSLPMLNFVTPTVVADLYTAEAKKGVEGVTARLVPYFLTEGGGGSTLVPETAFVEYEAMILKLLEIYHTQEADAEKYEVTVAPDALDLLNSFKAEIQEKIIPSMTEVAIPYLRKAHGQAARFAWDLHAAGTYNLDLKPHHCAIQASTMAQAIALVRVTFEHARWIYDPCGFPAYAMASKVIKSLLRISPEEWQDVLFNGKDSTALQQRVGAKYAEMNNALRFLERHNVLAVYDDGTRNLKIVLHPLFFITDWTQLGVHLD